MRKLISGVLAFAIILCMCVPALASDITPIYEWTDDEWTYAMENWTIEDCYNYVAWEEGLWEEDFEAYYQYHEILYAAMEEWTDEQTEFYYYMQEAYYIYYESMWVQQQKETYAFPYMDGINVQVNGGFITFSGPRAVAVDGITMIPADAFAGALGASYSYSGSTGTMTLRGKSVSFTAGQEVSMSSGYGWDYDTYEYVEKFTTATPYLEDGVLMIPLRSVCNEYAFTLCWLQEYKLAAVLDRDAIVAEINENFTIINNFISLLLTSDAPTKTDGATETTLSASLEGMFYGEHDNTSAKLTMDMTLLTSGADMMAEVNIDTDTENLIELIELASAAYSSYNYYYDNDYISELIELISTYVDGQHSFILKGEEGDFYIKSPLYALTAPVAEGKWVRSSVDTGDYTLDVLSGLFGVGTGLTLGDYIYDNQYFSTYYYQNYYELLMKEAAIMGVFVGDDAFTSDGNGTYSISGDADSAFKAAVAAGLYGESDEWSFAYYYDTYGLVYSLKFTEDNGTLSAYSIDISVAPAGSVPGVLSLSAAYSTDSFSVDIAFIGNIVGKIIFELDATTSPTTKTVSAPPEAEVIDESSLVGTPSYPEDEDWGYYGWIDYYL